MITQFEIDFFFVCFLLTVTSSKMKPIIPILCPFNWTVIEGLIKFLSSGRSLKSQLAQTIGNVTFFRKGSSPSIPSSNSWFPGA